MLSVEIDLLKGATLRGRAGLPSLHSPAGPREGSWGGWESPLHKHLPMGALGLSMAVDKDRILGLIELCACGCVLSPNVSGFSLAFTYGLPSLRRALAGMGARRSTHQ